MFEPTSPIKTNTCNTTCHIHDAKGFIILTKLGLLKKNNEYTPDWEWREQIYNLCKKYKKNKKSTTTRNLNKMTGLDNLISIYQ